MKSLPIASLFILGLALISQTACEDNRNNCEVEGVESDEVCRYYQNTGGGISMTLLETPDSVAGGTVLTKRPFDEGRPAPEDTLGVWVELVTGVDDSLSVRPATSRSPETAIGHVGYNFVRENQRLNPNVVLAIHQLKPNTPTRVDSIRLRGQIVEIPNTTWDCCEWEDAIDLQLIDYTFDPRQFGHFNTIPTEGITPAIDGLNINISLQ